MLQNIFSLCEPKKKYDGDVMKLKHLAHNVEKILYNYILKEQHNLRVTKVRGCYGGTLPTCRLFICHLHSFTRAVTKNHHRLGLKQQKFVTSVWRTAVLDPGVHGVGFF